MNTLLDVRVLGWLLNVGPALGRLGPIESFAEVPGYAKLALSFLMLAGRLEIFTLLVLFAPGFWRR
jgi:trk system potassium uptake protein TrkH